jgi:hypothetical protein
LGTAVYLVALFFFTEALIIRKADAQLIGPLPQNIVGLNGAATPGTPINLAAAGSSSPYVVPPNKSFILTDIVISPQSFPPTGGYLSQITSITPQQTVISQLTVPSAAEEPSSFQIHLNTGMVFKAGRNIPFLLVFGNSGVNVSASGFTYP